MGVTGMMAGEVMERGGEGVMELRWRMSQKGEGVKVEEMESRWRRRIGWRASRREILGRRGQAVGMTCGGIMTSPGFCRNR